MPKTKAVHHHTIKALQKVCLNINKRLEALYDRKGRITDSKLHHKLVLRRADHLASLAVLANTPEQVAANYSSNAPLAVAPVADDEDELLDIDELAPLSGDPSFPDEDFEPVEDDEDDEEGDAPQLGVKPDPVI